MSLLYMYYEEYGQIWRSFGYSENSTYITQTRLFKYIENFTSKNWNFSDKIL